MEEQNRNVKRRERIKTILIIFLALMLVLTFFSNTILNYSLPTVTAQYAGYGTISEKVRGSGIVKANKNYDVVAVGNRTVTSVNVKQGDHVKKGDTLFVFDAVEGDESVEAAEQELETLELTYQKALLTIAPSYEKENQDIANARKALQDAVNRLNEAKRNAGNNVSEADYRKATSDAQKYTQEVTTLSGYLAAISTGETTGVPSKYLSGMSEAKSAYDAADADLAQASADLETKKAALTVDSATQKTAILALERTAEEAQTAYVRAKEDYDAGGTTELQRIMEDAQQAAKYAQEDVDNAKAVLTEIQAKEAEIAAAEDTVSSAQSTLNDARKKLDAAAEAAAAAIQKEIDSAQSAADKAQEILNSYDAEGAATDLDALQADVTLQEQTLQGLIITLADTKRNDELTEQQNAIDLKSQQQTIENKKKELEEMKKNSGTMTIKCENKGIVSSVNFSAGDPVMDGAVLAGITLTDAGYTVEFSVSAEQARKVSVGTVADITNGYYNSDTKATLVSSKANIEQPNSTDRILTFDITGSDITVGQMLGLSISCSSQSYDCVVPSSAIMEDNDGKFVLVMRSKSTPLGNRYYCSRANVTVLASDEMSSAVQGDVSYSDFVITASEKPLTPGMQVRQEEGT